MDAIARDIAALGLMDPANLGPIAFWLAVQERYAEAAAVYARIGPLPEAVAAEALLAVRVCPRCCEPTVRPAVRTRRRSSPPGISPRYAATAEPQEWKPTGTRSTWPRSQRTKATRTKPWQHCAPRSSSRTCLGFRSELPWFRSLEGHSGYAEVLAERQRRIDQARTEMRAIEAQYPDSVIVKTIQTALSRLLNSVQSPITAEIWL